MEFVQILNTLWQRKLALVCVFALSVLVALATSFRIGLHGLSKRSHQYGAAQAQLMIDSPRSSLIDLSQDPVPLATRAAVYTEFMRSNAAKQAIAKTTGVPVNSITAEGPFTTAGGTQNIPRPSEARSNEVRQEGDAYRLVFDYQQDLPIVSVYAQAPTPEAAIRLADGSVTGVRNYVSGLESQQNVPPSKRTQIRALGAAEGGWVNSGVNAVVMMLAFVATFIAGCGVIVMIVAVSLGVRRLAEEDQGFDPVIWEADLSTDPAMNGTPPEGVGAGHSHES